jgi:hypothetical protein
MKQTNELPIPTDEKGNPITFWGGLAEHKQENDYTALLKPVGTKQTAVEWLEEQIICQQNIYIDLAKKNKLLKKQVDAILTATTLLKMKCKQAKEMEKQKFLDFQVYVVSEHLIAKEHFRKQRDEGLLEQLKMYSEADKIMEFLDNETKLGLSDGKTIERIKWYFETYFEQFKKK